MEQIWWERVPNALSFVNDIVGSLVDEKSMILQHSVPLPWQASFISFVKDSVKQQNSSKTFEAVSGTEKPGPYLLREFCKPEKRAQYRPSKSYADFLAESDDIVLHERYIWVTISSAEQLEAWTSFVSDYIKGRSKNKEPAAFVLDWQGTELFSRKKGVAYYSFDDYIGEYDRVVFSMLASSSIPGGTFIKNYLAELAANVIGNDIELYAKCFKCYREFMVDPYDVVTSCAANSLRSDGSSFQFFKSRSEVEHSVWLAQIRTIYPIIEEFREDFVQKHKAAVKAQLPITSSYGEVYDDPNDVELGTLVYMAGSGKLTLNTKEYDKLIAFKDARNTLSHLGIIPLEKINHLFE